MIEVSLSRFSSCAALLPLLRALPLLLLLPLAGCPASDLLGPGRGRLGASVPPTHGVYAAVIFDVQRESQTLNLLAEEGIRLVIELRPDGTISGQLKITADSPLRTKRSLDGTYAVAGRVVRFEFYSQSFLEEVGFRYEQDTLRGTWATPELQVIMELARTG